MLTIYIPRGSIMLVDVHVKSLCPDYSLAGSGGVKFELNCKNLSLNIKTQLEALVLQDIFPPSLRVVNKLSVLGKGNTDLTKLQRRWLREPKKSNRFNEQNNNLARASRFFVHFFTVPSQLRRKMAKV